MGDEKFCREVVAGAISTFGHIEILVNNAAEQHVRDSIMEIENAQLERTFRTNIFSMFYMVKAALPYLKKGAIVAFTRSLSLQLVEKMLSLPVPYGHR